MSHGNVTGAEVYALKCARPALEMRDARYRFEVLNFEAIRRNSWRDGILCCARCNASSGATAFERLPTHWRVVTVYGDGGESVVAMDGTCCAQLSRKGVRP